MSKPTPTHTHSHTPCYSKIRPVWTCQSPSERKREKRAMVVEGEGGGDLEDGFIFAPTSWHSTAGVAGLDCIQLHPLCSRELDVVRAILRKWHKRAWFCVMYSPKPISGHLVFHSKSNVWGLRCEVLWGAWLELALCLSLSVVLKHTAVKSAMPWEPAAKKHTATPAASTR